MTREPTVMFGVGATKAGTTWLHDYLRGHPDCHFRAIKELHYFDTLQDAGTERHIRRVTAEAEGLQGRIGQAEQDAAKVRRLQRRLRDLQEWTGVLQAEPGDLSGYLDYLRDGTSRGLVGDITPAYSLLPVDRLRGMAAMAADVRFVYLMRDPVARLWSHVRMIAGRKAGPGTFAALASRLMDKVLAGSGDGTTRDIVVRGDYAGALARLSAAVPAGRLLVACMEDLLSAPGVARLCRFLGIADHPADLERRVHEGPALALDDRRRGLARDLLRPQYLAAAGFLGALPEAWQRNMPGLAA